MLQASQLAAELEVAKANLARVTGEKNAHVAAHEGKIRALELTAARAVKNYDKAQAALDSTTAKYQRAAEGLANLELAVQDLQAERDAMVLEATAGLTKQLEGLRSELAGKERTLAEAEQQRHVLESHVKAVAELESERNLANGICKSLENDVARLQRELGEAQGKLAEALSSAPTNVDIELIRNMFVTFCEQTGEKKAQALLPLAKILQLSDADKYTVGIRPRRGFFSQLISGPTMAPETPGKAKARSFAEEMVEFMMKEAGGDAASASSAQTSGSTTASGASATPSTAASTVFPDTNDQAASLVASYDAGYSNRRLSREHTPLKVATFSPAQTPQ
eukprot:m.1256803 g.1256803  ORF g.1256803 m.1256803 type:complete len:337 (-) comp24712_c0_seq28:2913-3923(-)